LLCCALHTAPEGLTSRRVLPLSVRVTLRQELSELHPLCTHRSISGPISRVSSSKHRTEHLNNITYKLLSWNLTVARSRPLYPRDIEPFQSCMPRLFYQQMAKPTANMKAGLWRRRGTRLRAGSRSSVRAHGNNKLKSWGLHDTYCKNPPRRSVMDTTCKLLAYMYWGGAKAIFVHLVHPAKFAV
jgi:hypothetical protein